MKENIPTGDNATGASRERCRSNRPPFDQVRQNPSRLQVEESAAPSKGILIADDDTSVRYMLGRVLELEHYSVVRAKTGREAAAIFLSDLASLVLLDLNLPEKDGWEAFHLMNAVNPMIPVIIITARPGQQEQATRMGADALMDKPLDLPLLLETIRRFLAEPAEERSHRRSDPDFRTLYLNHCLKVT